MEIRGLLQLWFGLRVPVDRRAYLLSGLSLMALRYVGDTAILAGTGTPALIGLSST